MCGIAGIVSINEELPANIGAELASELRFRAPDGDGSWTAPGVVLAHALFTTSSRDAEPQPLVRDDLAIVADARLDIDPAELDPRSSATDASVILAAYERWGTAAPEHLSGEFSFAIWDQKRRRLFCARDVFGVKPFYYSMNARQLVFSNTLSVVKRRASDALNETTIGDFFLFAFNQNLETTSFHDICRLPPGHSLLYDAGGKTILRFASVEPARPVRYRRPSDYLEHFEELFQRAVRNRLPNGRVSILLSGGLDSPSVAFEAKASKPDIDLHGFTAVYDRIFPDEERHYASLVSSRLAVPITFLPADDFGLYANWPDWSRRQIELSDQPLSSVYEALLRAAARHSRVALTGNGSDPVMLRRPNYLVDLLRRFRFLRFGREAMLYFVIHHRVPALGVRTWLRWMIRREPPLKAEFPSWIDPDFAKRLRLRERWEEINTPTRAPVERQEAWEMTTSPFWTWLFEHDDPGSTGVLLELRSPFFDAHLVRYLLALPPMPWFGNKDLLRAMLLGHVPEAIRLRRKTPLQADPVVARLREHFPWSELLQSDEVRPFVNGPAVEAAYRASKGGARDADFTTTPISFAFWIKEKNAPLRARHIGPTRDDRS
jgi:asparagine synthase (glutamine-hydrolysing)